MVRRRVGTCSARPNRRRSSRPSCRPSPAAPPLRAPRGCWPRRRSRRARPRRWRPGRAASSASSSPTAMISSITERSSTSGTNPAPIPWILCGPGWPPERTGELAGSTATTSVSGERSFSIRPTPVIVPPVPTPLTKAPISPSVSRQISSAVVRRCASGVGRVGELHRHEGLALVADLFGERHRLVHPAEARRLPHLGAVGAQQLVALAAHPFRQGQDQLVAARRADHRQGDPGVAAGRLDHQRAPRFDLPRLFGGVDHRHPDPVLHRAAGIEVLELRADLPEQPLAEPLEQHHRSVADDGGGLGADPHRGESSRGSARSRRWSKPACSTSPAGSMPIFSATRREAALIGRIIATTSSSSSSAANVERRRGGLGGEALAVALRVDRPEHLDPGPVADVGPAQPDPAEVVAALPLDHRPRPEPEALPVGFVFAQPGVAVGGLEGLAAAAGAATRRPSGASAGPGSRARRRGQAAAGSAARWCALRRPSRRL